MEIYTDGSCSGNPGLGGFGVIVVYDDKIISAYQYRSISPTTNNRMEMEAIIYALENYGDYLNSPIVYSDSAYCVNTFNIWIKDWKAKGWKRANGKPLENLDLIKKYDKLNQIKNIDLQKIKGHSGQRYNELADSLAKGILTPEEVLNIYGESNKFKQNA